MFWTEQFVWNSRNLPNCVASLHSSLICLILKPSTLVLFTPNLQIYFKNPFSNMKIFNDLKKRTLALKMRSRNSNWVFWLIFKNSFFMHLWFFSKISSRFQCTSSNLILHKKSKSKKNQEKLIWFLPLHKTWRNQGNY